MTNWYAFHAKAEQRETEISIFDEIGMFGVSAKNFISDLKSVPDDHKIKLRIHSPGGEVFDGNAIFNALKRHPGGVEVQIEGLAASMATVISLAGLPVKMAANGFYMIHNPWGVAMGDADELRDQAQLLDKIRSGMVSAYAAKSGQPTEKIEEWMNDETWFSAEEALAAGFVDEVTDEVRLAASANRFSRLAKFKRPPAALLTPAPAQMETEIENPVAEPEVAASVVSENADQPTPSDSSEPILEPAPEIEPEPLEAAIEPQPEIPTPATPVAHIAAADSILAKYNAAIAERDAARSEIIAYKAQLDTVRAELTSEREALQRLERSLGLQAAAVVPIIQPQSDATSDPVAEYLAALESGDRKAASKLFEKHKAAIWQHRNKISKA
jgi:ATP-dependent Clp endopeptidase proteolytic subunit ClpP